MFVCIYFLDVLFNSETACLAEYFNHVSRVSEVMGLQLEGHIFPHQVVLCGL